MMRIKFLHTHMKGIICVFDNQTFDIVLLQNHEEPSPRTTEFDIRPLTFLSDASVLSIELFDALSPFSLNQVDEEKIVDFVAVKGCEVAKVLLTMSPHILQHLTFHITQAWHHQFSDFDFEFFLNSPLSSLPQSGALTPLNFSCQKKYMLYSVLEDLTSKYIEEIDSGFYDSQYLEIKASSFANCDLTMPVTSVTTKSIFTMSCLEGEEEDEDGMVLAAESSIEAL
ncbi:hypothetical protein RJ641_012558 [Dillenia turbinata]|uniref:Uncharacterized protein n=1 Tax=Dillenia turbinata TaxID=194707 RepID=A0AAN8Z2D7_9MAGN